LQDLATETVYIQNLSTLLQGIATEVVTSEICPRKPSLTVAKPNAKSVSANAKSVSKSVSAIVPAF